MHNGIDGCLLLVAVSMLLFVILCSSRYCGELTSVSGSLRELLPSAKSLFYIRKLLKKQQLIKSQVTGKFLPPSKNFLCVEMLIIWLFFTSAVVMATT